METNAELIYIWDDGESYSSHTVYFIDPCGLTRDEMDVVLRWKKKTCPCSYLIAVCAPVDWREDYPVPIGDFVDIYVRDGARQDSFAWPEALEKKINDMRELHGQKRWDHDKNGVRYYVKGVR